MNEELEIQPQFVIKGRRTRPYGRRILGSRIWFPRGAAGAGGDYGYILRERFEATGAGAAGYDNAGWIELGGILIDPNYTAVVLEGAQSCLLDGVGLAARLDSAVWAPALPEVWAYFLFLAPELPAAVNQNIFDLKSGGAASIQIRLQPTGQLSSSGTVAQTANGMLPGVMYHIWVHYRKGTGANAVVDIGFSTDGIRPTSGGNFAQVTTAANTVSIDNVRLEAPTPMRYLFDKVLVHDVELGNNGVPLISPLLTGLVSYWKMDEGSGNALDAHGANPGVDTNTVLVASGKIGTSRNFQAVNLEYFVVADNATVDFTTAFTISAWVRGSPLAVQAAIMVKFVSGGGQSTWALQLGPTASNLRMFIASAVGDVGTIFADFTAGLVSDVWAHVVMVYDGTQAATDRVKMYVNNVSLTPTITGVIPVSLPNSTSAIRIGSFEGQATRYWQGQLDEIGLWSRGLSPAAVGLLYNSNAGRAYPFTLV